VIVLDTHAIVWFAMGEGIGRQSRRLVDKAFAEEGLAVSTISFWELAMLVTKQRVRSIRSAGEQRSKMLAAGIRELPVTGEIAILAAELDGLHNDPADRIIAATAIAHEATLVTADARLLHGGIP